MPVRPATIAAVLLCGLSLFGQPAHARGNQDGYRLDPAERERLRGDLRQHAYQDRQYRRGAARGDYGRGYPPPPPPGYQGPPPGYQGPPPAYAPAPPYGGGYAGPDGNRGMNGAYSGYTGQGPYGYGPMPAQGAAPRLTPDERQQLRRQLRDARVNPAE